MIFAFLSCCGHILNGNIFVSICRVAYTMSADGFCCFVRCLKANTSCTTIVTCLFL
jgi:hypothetical protein